MLKKLLSFGAIFAVLVAAEAAAQVWQVESADKQVAVMELFVSEGCGLCPAAERWVDKLPAQGIDDELIVLGFHVDYLDTQKGWIDRFAKPRYTERQQQMARLNLFQTVFTPGIFIGGEILHNWQEHGVEAIEFINSFDAEAELEMRAELEQGELSVDTRVKVSGQENQQHAKLYLAVTEDNVISEIHGGDNIGAVFNHQHLVRRWLGPFELDPSGDTRLETTLGLEQEWKRENLTLVAVVQNLYDGYVLQGLSMPLTD